MNISVNSEQHQTIHQSHRYAYTISTPTRWWSSVSYIKQFSCGEAFIISRDAIHEVHCPLYKTRTIHGSFIITQLPLRWCYRHENLVISTTPASLHSWRISDLTQPFYCIKTSLDHGGWSPPPSFLSLFRFFLSLIVLFMLYIISQFVRQDKART